LKAIAGDSKIYKKIVPQQLAIRETSAKNGDISEIAK
jgi:hypothetical protein